MGHIDLNFKNVFLAYCYTVELSLSLISSIIFLFTYACPFLLVCSSQPSCCPLGVCLVLMFRRNNYSRLYSSKNIFGCVKQSYCIYFIYVFHFIFFIDQYFRYLKKNFIVRILNVTSLECFQCHPSSLNKVLSFVFCSVAIYLMVSPFEGRIIKLLDNPTSYISKQEMII